MYICLVGQKAAPKKCVFLNTSKDVRSDMRCWAVSDAGDRWSVRLDIRDLGGHLDSTFLARAFACLLLFSVFVYDALA